MMFIIAIVYNYLKTVKRYEEMIKAQLFYLVNMKAKRPLEKLRRRREDSIKTDLKERGCQDVDWIHLIQDRD
jgi:hypothetical protein